MKRDMLKTLLRLILQSQRQDWLVNNYFQVHLITGEFEIEEDVGLSHVSNMLERLGDAIVIGFDKKKITYGGKNED